MTAAPRRNRPGLGFPGLARRLAGCRGREGDRGAVTVADRLAPAEEGQGRPDRRRRGRLLVLLAIFSQLIEKIFGLDPDKTHNGVNPWSTPRRRSRSARWAASPQHHLLGVEPGTARAATCSRRIIDGSWVSLLVASAATVAVGRHRRVVGCHRRLLRRLGRRGHQPAHGHRPGLPAAAVRDRDLRLAADASAFGLTGLHAAHLRARSSSSASSAGPTSAASSAARRCRCASASSSTPPAAWAPAARTSCSRNCCRT